VLVLFRFGNYIGEAGGSEEESQHGDVGAETYAYDIESEGEAVGLINDQQLMEIDGDDLQPIVLSYYFQPCELTLEVDQTRVHQMQSSYTKINSTIQPRSRSMVQMSRL
jgi:hypothetical protein